MQNGERLERALRNAHNAGDHEAARRIAQEIKKARDEQGQVENRDLGQQPPSHHADQLAMFGKLDKAIEGAPGRTYAAGGQVTNATTFGAYDRLMAGVDQLYSRTQGESDRSYSDSLADVRSSRQNMREMHPLSSGAGDVAGAIAGGFGIDDAIRGGVDRSIAKLPQARNALEKAQRYSKRLGGLFADGLAQYGAYTLGARAANQEAEEGRSIGAQERLGMLNPTEAAISAAAGPAMSGMYRGGRGVMTGRVTPKNVPGGGGTAPALQDIQGMKSQAYADAEALGVAYTPDAYANMVAKIENTLEQAGADPQLNASVTSMLNNMQKRVGDQPITMETLDKVRQQVRENVISPAYRAARDGDVRLGNIIIDEIDDFIASGVGAVSNNGQAGSAAIQKARALNSVWRKSQALQDAVENATLRSASTGSGGNFENALRQEIRKIYQNPKKVAGFSELERKAMRAVIEGDLGQNVLRNIGKLSPQGNGLMAALGVGTTAANPVLAPVWLGAMGAKHLAQRGIKNKFDELDEMVREGANNLPMKNITPQDAQKAASGGYSAKDKALDASALGLIASGAAGNADAQTMSIDDRIYSQEQQIQSLEQEREAIKRDIAILNDPEADVVAVQRILQARVNPDLLLDGLRGPQTGQAAQDLRAQLTEGLVTKAQEIEDAQGEMGRLRIAAAEDRHSNDGLMSQLQSKAPLAALVVGGIIGGRSRGGAVRQSKKDALAMEQRANNLVDPNSPVRSDFTQNQDARGILQKINFFDSPTGAQRADELAYQEAMQNLPPRVPPRYTSGPQGVNSRANSINEFERLGGAKPGQTTFKEKADGDFIANAPKNVVDPSKLFRGPTIPGTPIPNPFKLKDIGIMGSFGAESYYSSTLLEKEKAKIEQARNRMAAARAQKDDVAFEAALRDLRQHEAMATTYDALMRLGMGIAGARGLGALKQPYARPQPNMRNARREAGSIKETIAEKRRNSAGGSNPN